MSDESTQKNEEGELVGKTLGQYHIQKMLGQGGMATVYLAHQPSIDRTVAIKVMPMYFMHDPSFLQRFEREVKVIAKLQHPRIVPVYDYGQIESRPYIVMAYMPGGTLADRIKEGPLPLPEVVRVTEQIAEGLDHAHREGIIHRDFKPSNVLLDRSGNAHLADFGIAKVSEQTVALTGSAVVGTPAYMAPEMASEGLVTEAVDIYALGVTLYQMLTGKYPYSGDTPLRVMMAHATEPIPDVRAERPDVPEAVAEVVRRAMAKDPADRYASAGDVAKDLRLAASGKPTQPMPKAARQTLAPTVIEPVGSSAPTAPISPPTPSPVATPPPPAYTPTPAAVVTPPMAMPTPERRGCRGPLLIGGIIGAVVLVGGCIAVAALGGLASVASLFASPTATPIPTPTATLEPTAIPTPVQSSSGLQLELVNNSGGTICYVYFTESDVRGWGSDQLGATEVIAAGDTRLFTLDAGTWDMKTEDCDHNVISWNYSVVINPGDQPVLTVSGSTHQLVIENQSNVDLCAVYVSPTTSNTWGRPQIDDDNPVLAGTTRSVSVTAGNWDLRAEPCDGSAPQERYNENLSGEMVWTFSD